MCGSSCIVSAKSFIFFIGGCLGVSQCQTYVFFATILRLTYTLIIRGNDLNQLSKSLSLTVFAMLFLTKAFAMEVGINFISVGNQYANSIYDSENVTGLFNYLAKENVKRVSIRVTWTTMEPEEGKYNQKYLDNLNRVLTAAKNNKINVLLDFHTLFMRSNYACPPWVMNYEADDGSSAEFSVIMAARSIHVRRTYLAMLSNVWRSVSRTGAVDVVSVMNEPWAFNWKNPDNDMRQITELLCEAGDLFKSIAPEIKTTVRFTSGMNPWTTERGKRFDFDLLVKHLSFFSINIYEDPSVQSVKWDYFDKALELARKNKINFWVTEFGQEGMGKKELGGEASLESQQMYYRSFLERINRNENLKPDCILAWNAEPGGKNNSSLWDNANHQLTATGILLSSFSKTNQ